MAPPTPLQCSVHDCEFSTPEGCPTWELMSNLLTTHTAGVHTAQASHMPGSRPKMKPIPNPEVEENCTEADWRFFISKWERYKRSCLKGASEQDIADQLMASCSTPLQQSMWRKHGSINSETEAKLLELIKAMAVKQQNTLVNVVDFLGTGQDSGESAKHFCARLQGMANVCNFVLPVGENDFTSIMVRNQLIRGLSDPEIQEQVLSSFASTSKEATLTETLNLIEAKESGKSDSRLINQTLVNSLAHVNKASAYKKGERSGDQKEEAPDNRPCGWCSKKGHGKNSPSAVREAKCPAFGKPCSKCSRPNHNAESCRSKVSVIQPGAKNNSVGVTDMTAKEALEDVGPWCQIEATSLPCSHSQQQGSAGGLEFLDCFEEFPPGPSCP